MNAQPESEVARRSEVAPRLLAGERAAVDIGIHEVGQPLLAHQRQHVPDHPLDVFVRAAVVLRWNDVRPQVRRHDLQRMRVQIAEQPQRLPLSLLIKAVARLGFQCRRPVTRELLQLPPRLIGQGRRGCGPHGTHRRADAPTGGGDGVIIRAAQPHLEIVEPRRAEDQMRVAIDETGHDHAPPGVNLLDCPSHGEPFDRSLGAGGDNAARIYQDSAI